jgi:DNA polymerase/3'-5' exonuclease PolX
MEPIVNESNRLLFQAFVSIAKQYAAIDEMYRSKALEKSSNVIANYPGEITRASQLIGFPGVGAGTLRRINIFLRIGSIKIEDHEYTRAASNKRSRELAAAAVPVPDQQPPNQPHNEAIKVDVLVPGKCKYPKLIIMKREYSLTRETEDYYYFS